LLLNFTPVSVSKCRPGLTAILYRGQVCSKPCTVLNREVGSFASYYY